MPAAALVTLAAVLAAVAGVKLVATRGRVRLLLPFSAGVLIGLALFGLLPAAFNAIQPPVALLLFGFGYLVVMTVDRFIYPVCPSCSHDHDHDSCTDSLHGFAVPLAVATALHAFLDGWSLAAAQISGGLGLAATVPLGLLLHKLPEGLALGAMMRAAVRSRAAAFGWPVAAETATLAGAAIAYLLAPRLGTVWVPFLLATAGGSFFYLGLHAVHGAWRPALTGAAGMAALQQGVRVWFR
ncbi:MAG: hypothetical protein FJW37_01535 [Acidobacteria bacterium]|nr:hypothetical protein [Acidobacteriota bacterium]